MALVTQVNPRRFRLRDIVEDRRIVLMLALGFSSGLPLLLVLGTFTLRLAFSDIDVKTIGLFSYVALPYSLKFLWAPMIDRLDVPSCPGAGPPPGLDGDDAGRHRRLCLVLMAFADPKTDLALLGLGAFLVAFCAASQDVVIDGWRIDAAGSDLQGILAATSNLGYRLGLITAGAGALFIAASGGWTVAYLSMAGMMLVGLVAALLAPSYDNRKAEAGEAGRSRLWSARRALVEPLTELHGRFGRALVLILLLVALFRLPDFLAGVMASPLYRTLGFDLKEIAPSPSCTGSGSASRAGSPGLGAGPLGLFPTLCSADSWRRPRICPSRGSPRGAGAVAAHRRHFGREFLRLLRRHRAHRLHVEPDEPAYAATQYALFSSLYALPGKLIAGSAGFIVAAIGYPAFFTLTSLIGLPVLALCVLVGRRTGRQPKRL